MSDATYTADQIKISERATEFFCPVCDDQHLFVATLARTQVCGCKKCHGFLIDSATLGDLIRHLRANHIGPDDQPTPINQRELQEKINCPTCFQTMFTHAYNGPGNSVINSCSDCQLNWFDAGELASIISAPGIR